MKLEVFQSNLLTYLIPSALIETPFEYIVLLIGVIAMVDF
jgi:hypothetical protein